MTEVGYGYIVAAFQLAYALGLLAAGRFVDKVGTRIGYMVIMAIWSLSAMGHALANTVLEFGIARFSLGLGESGNFPAAIKTVAEWFPQNERSLATGIFNSGTNLGAILRPLIVPWVTMHYGWHAAFLVTGVFSARGLSCGSSSTANPPTTPPHRRRTAAHQPEPADWSPGPPRLDQVARPSPDLGIYRRQVSHRSHLVVLSLLAALLFQRRSSIWICLIWGCR